VNAVARNCTFCRDRHSIRFLIRALVITLALGAAACASPLAPQDGYAAELQYCADEVNRLRSTVARAALRRSADLESFAKIAAQHDSAVRIAHYHFNATDGGGVSTAETEILWWRGFSVRRVIELGLAQMWAVGPGGEHYDVLVGGYAEIGCGIAVDDSEVTVTQEFR
jgi:hypothetical protein